ncbi:hypothetical protein ABB37_00911 [Leptomonas pyrrhocoris]|uniref:Uncharacterized protein n=1 Tax=Leptomonas pyrrhocoris TaxID=157538 RepID=A0A0N1J5J1_LEPPY|nr:hypothetical protein ABB37_00911 [Leptomonas pyrrhocoris]KPA86864.1 hypothetical protein ABB37_00911 [Leptomonas pyrrhocoris]|eukprot:XP_015665303.1 hypothetical protein ABB37_00911 [Leptomonas pyrrhocoris]
MIRKQMCRRLCRRGVVAVKSACLLSLLSGQWCSPLKSASLLRRAVNSVDCTVIVATRQLSGSSASVGSSAYLCSCRWSATDAAAAPAWQRLVRLITYDSHSRIEADSDMAAASSADTTHASEDAFDADLCHRASPLRRLWIETYHPVFQQGTRATLPSSSPHPSPHRSQCGTQSPHPPSCTVERSSDDRFPGEAAELPAFVQALGTLTTTLNACIRQSIATDRLEASPFCVSDAEALSVVELFEWRSEVQALLLYVGRHQLRFLIPTAFRKTSSFQREPPCVMMKVANEATATHDVAERAQESVPTEQTHLMSNTVDADQKVSHAPPVQVDYHTQLQPLPSPLPSLRRLSRSKDERLRHKAPPLPPEELLRVVVLVEAVRTILEAAHPPAQASGVRAELYAVLLSVLGASEQLSSLALVSLTTCLARCLDSYITCQQLPPLTLDIDSLKKSVVQREGADTLDATPPEDNLFSFYRPVEWEDNSSRSVLDSTPTVRASVIEDAEAVHLARYRGGLNTMLRPTEVLQHLSVLAHVAQHRLERALRAPAAMNFLQDFHETSCSSPWDESATRASFRNGTHASTVRLAKQEQIEEGMLGLLSLQERKARQATEADAAASTAAVATAGQKPKNRDDKQRPPARPRRTIAAIQEEARRKAAVKLQLAEGADEGALAGSTAPPAVTSSSVESPPAPASQVAPNFAMHSSLPSPPSFFSVNTTDITLTDVAEICTAFAAMGYRGGGSASSSEEPFWVLVADFTRAEINAVAKARDSAVRRDTVEQKNNEDGPAGGDIVSTSSVHHREEAEAEDEESRETVLRQLTRDARDIVFALDRVGFTRGYDQVMTQLVRHAFVSAPIPAPSAGARAMRKVDGKRVEGL